VGHFSQTKRPLANRLWRFDAWPIGMRPHVAAQYIAAGNGSDHENALLNTAGCV
jgi:hypothetical protein